MAVPLAETWSLWRELLTCVGLAPGNIQYRSTGTCLHLPVSGIHAACGKSWLPVILWWMTQAGLRMQW